MVMTKGPEGKLGADKSSFRATLMTSKAHAWDNTYSQTGDLCVTQQGIWVREKDVPLLLTRKPRPWLFLRKSTPEELAGLEVPKDDARRAIPDDHQL